MRKTALLILILALTSAPLLAQRSTISKPKRAASQAVAPAALPPSAAAAMKSIDPQRIRAHVKFLSSDLLEGRGTGQRGGDIAADYIATQFESYGLKPAGDNGSYMQKVPMVGIITEPSTSIYFLQAGKTQKLKLGDDIVAMDETQNADDNIDADLVFVGYGIDAPEYQWNDFKDADVRGKILLMFVNEPVSDDPNFFKGKALTYYGRWTYKYEEAARRGAVGVILIHKTDMASYGWDVVKNSWGGERSYLRADGQPSSSSPPGCNWKSRASCSPIPARIWTPCSSRRSRATSSPSRCRCACKDIWSARFARSFHKTSLPCCPAPTPV